jgi:hypothetical protein
MTSYEQNEVTEVQAHGNVFEDIIIREFTGMSKNEYDKLKPNGYTSTFDLVKGIITKFNYSIKTTGKMTVECADILKRMEEKEYKLIVGCYNQKGENKIFHTQYEFFITSDDDTKLWGDMTYEQIVQFVNFVRAIPPGKGGQKNTLKERNILKEQIQCKNSLMKINPKVDSKNQRRVQCSFKLKEILLSGIPYIKKDINIIIQSKKRTFNK